MHHVYKRGIKIFEDGCLKTAVLDLEVEDASVALGEALLLGNDPVQ